MSHANVPFPLVQTVSGHYGRASTATASSDFCRPSLLLDRHMDTLLNIDPNNHNNMLATLNPAAAVIVVGPSKYLPRNAATTPVQAKVRSHCQIKIPSSQSRLGKGKKMSIPNNVAVRAERLPAVIAYPYSDCLVRS